MLPIFPRSIHSLPAAGSTYTSEIQYGLGGEAYDGDNGGGAIYFTYLKYYLVINTVTCVFRPVAIGTAFKKIYGGSGRFERHAASKVDSVDQTTVLESFPGNAENPINPLQFQAQRWETQLEVDYVKPYLHSSML